MRIEDFLHFLLSRGVCYYDMHRFQNILSIQVLTAILVFSQACYGQSDTISIAAFEVVAEQTKAQLAGSQITRIDLTEEEWRQGQSVSDFLQNQSSVVMRGYGPGASFGLSIRGAGTGQSQVLLDGIPFENPSLGSTDISLLPVSIFSGMDIYRGGAGAYLGNATIGGSLMLNTESNTSESFVMQNIGLGSFGKRTSVTSAKLNFGKLTSKTVFYFQQSQNDFDRTNPFDKDEEEPQPNAFFKARGLMQKLDFKASDKTQIGAMVWVNETYRQIPPNYLKPTSSAWQDDENLRVQLNLVHSWKQLKIRVSGAYDAGKIRYNDFGIDSKSSYETYHLQAKLERSSKHIDVYGMAIWHDDFAKTESYLGQESRQSPAIVGGAVGKWNGDKSKVSLTVRQELLNGNPLPVVAVLGFESQMGKLFNVHASAGNTYRIPGMNDLYWSPGGNPNLKPESGWFQELGFGFKKAKSRYVFSTDITGFNRDIKNWILWKQLPGESYWSAVNLKNVRSYGADVNVQLTHLFGDFTWTHQANSTFVRSINIAGAEENSADGKQLIYTPEWVFAASESLAYKGYRIRFLGYFESERYATLDNKRSLDPFFTLDLEISKNFQIKEQGLDVFAAARNILNADYQLRASHPMPGVSFEIGVQLKYQFKKTKNNEI